MVTTIINARYILIFIIFILCPHYIINPLLHDKYCFTNSENVIVPDQKSVFPTIPINEVVSQIRSNFIELNIDKIGGLLIQDFIPLLAVVLANTYFVFEGQIYK